MKGNIFGEEILKLQASGIHNTVYFFLVPVCKFNVIRRSRLGSQVIILDETFIDKVVGSSTV